MKNKKVCCFISGAFSNLINGGEEFSQKKEFYEKIEREIINLAEKENIKTFYTGMESGGDLFAAECVLSLKEKEDISLYCVIPFEEQAAEYSDEERDRYYSVAQKSDGEIMFRRKRDFSCRKDRDIYMIEKSDVILLFWDMKAPYTASLLPFAKNKKIIVVDPSFSHSNSSFCCIE